MKNKIIKKTLLLGGIMLSLLSQATVITVTVANFSFSPASFTAVVGDTVKWVWSAGTHTTTSTSVPAGANTWNNPMNSSNTTFEYIITTPGNYNYWCAIHTTMMEASFTANPNSVPVITDSNKVVAFVFPNPANAQLTVKLSNYTPDNELVITDMLGKEIDRTTLKSTSNIIDISGWQKGVYLYTVRRNTEVMKGKFEIQ